LVETAPSLHAAMARLDPMAESLVELRPVAGLVTTRSYCSLWPYAAGSGSPVVGVPMGQHLDTGATVCADPISWFRTARLISVPSMFLLGNPALGKSMSIRHWEIKRTLGAAVAPGQVDRAYADARAAGATGGKLLGAGGGGFLLVHAPDAARDSVRTTLSAPGFVEQAFRFERRGVELNRVGAPAGAAPADLSLRPS